MIEAEKSVDEILASVMLNPVTDEELEKVKNQSEASLEFGEVEVMNRAMNLAFATLSGDPNFVNQESARIEAVTKDDIRRLANEILREENSSVLYYEAIS